MPHASCTHLGYRMTCAEYDSLFAESDGACALCGSCERVGIDHDHALGDWAVRGLLCKSCNDYLKFIDGGKIEVSPAIAAYFKNAWHRRQASSAAKARRAGPKTPCPTCGLPVTRTIAGRPRAHWSRLPGASDTRCPGSQLPKRPPQPEEGTDQ